MYLSNITIIIFFTAVALCSSAYGMDKGVGSSQLRPSEVADFSTEPSHKRSKSSQGTSSQGESRLLTQPLVQLAYQCAFMTNQDMCNLVQTRKEADKLLKSPAFSLQSSEEQITRVCDTQQGDPKALNGVIPIDVLKKNH